MIKNKMGKIELLDFSRIVPTQRYLQDKQVLCFFQEYLKGPMDIIVPVRRLEKKDLLFDGHHSLCSLELLKDFFPTNYYVWVAEHEEDFITSLPKNIHQDENSLKYKNWNINEKFYYIHELAFPEKGIEDSIKTNRNLQDLRNKYEFMESKDTLINFLKKEGVWKFK